MKSLLERLAQKHEIELLPPILDEVIDSFEVRAGFQLTSELRQLYRICGGLELSPWEAYILPFEKACQYSLDLRDAGFPDVWHYFPVLDFNESNPTCVCCGHVMTGYVVDVYRDDVAYVKYRCLQDMLENLLDDKPFDWSLRRRFIGDLQNVALRTSQDIQTARLLIQESQTTSDDIAQSDAFRFSFTLFSEEQVDEIIPFSDYPDEYIASYARNRLSEFSHPQAHAALEAYEKSRHAFLEECAQCLTQAGLAVYVDFKTCSIRLEPGPVHLNIPMAYAQRHQPDFWTYFVERASFFVEAPKFAAQCVEILKQVGIDAYLMDGTLRLGGPHLIKLDLMKLYQVRQRPDFEAYFVEHVRSLLEQKKK